MEEIIKLLEEFEEELADYGYCYGSEKLEIAIEKLKKQQLIYEKIPLHVALDKFNHGWEVFIKNNGYHRIYEDKNCHFYYTNNEGDLVRVYTKELINYDYFIVKG